MVNSKNSRIPDFCRMAGLALFSLLLATTSSPGKYNQLLTDSSVFLGGALSLLKGVGLYSGYWDHKPPGIFVVDLPVVALGELTGREMLPWIAWWWEQFLFLAALFVLYATLRRHMKSSFHLVSFFAVLIFWARSPSFYQGGNLTEGYALIVQLLALALVLASPNDAKNWALAGVCGGASFLFKQTAVAVPIALGAVLFLHSLRARNYRRFLAYMAGGLSLPVLALLIFAVFGNLGAFLDSVFTYNRMMVQQFQARSLSYAWDRSFMAAIPCAFALAGLLLAMLTKPFTERHAPSVLFLALVSLLIDLPLIALSGSYFGHYFLTLALGAAIGLAALSASVAHLSGKFMKKGALPICLGIFALALPLWPLIGTSINGARFFLSTNYGARAQARPSRALEATIEFLRNSPGDQVFVWGIRPDLSYLSGKTLFGRFPNIFPLLVDGYLPLEERLSFIDDLRKNLPIIVDGSAYENFDNFLYPSTERSVVTRKMYSLLSDRALYGSTRIGGYVVYIPTNSKTLRKSG